MDKKIETPGDVQIANNEISIDGSHDHHGIIKASSYNGHIDVSGNEIMNMTSESVLIITKSLFCHTNLARMPAKKK